MPEKPKKPGTRKKSGPAKIPAANKKPGTRKQPDKPGAGSRKAKPLVPPLPTPNSELQTGFYENVLDEAERLDFAAVRGEESVDDEIALLRVKIKDIVENSPDNTRLLLQALDILIKLVKARYSMNKEQKKSLGEEVRKVVLGLGLPLGIEALARKLQP